MRKQAIVAVVLSLLFAAFSHGQVIYEPVQSQFRTDEVTYHYAGTNPRVHQYAAGQCFYDARYTREGAYGVGYLHKGLIGRPSQIVYSDCTPYQNAVVYGYTSVDARNEAYARVPRYFRMGELLASAVVSADGMGVVVPAQARGTIEIRPVVPTPATKPATGPASQPKAILIIPKKVAPGSDAGKTVTDAR